MFLVISFIIIFNYSSTVSWIELGVGLIELGIDLRINNARRTVLARVSGLVFYVEGLVLELFYIFFCKFLDLCYFISHRHATQELAVLVSWCVSQLRF